MTKFVLLIIEISESCSSSDRGLEVLDGADSVVIDIKGLLISLLFFPQVVLFRKFLPE